MRRVERYPVEGPNALWQVYRTVSRLKAVRNFVFIQIARYCPELSVKNWIYRHVLGMKVGKETSFALMVMVDVFFPERITIGDNCIVGYNSTLLTHEYLIKEYRLGDIVIGSHVMIGANVTILPGVTIGDHAVIAAGSVVHKDVPAHARVGGNPLRMLGVPEEPPRDGRDEPDGAGGRDGEGPTSL